MFMNQDMGVSEHRNNFADFGPFNLFFSKLMLQYYEGDFFMKTSKSKMGMALVVVVAFTCIFTLLGFSILSLAGNEILLTQKELNSTKAFYAAEAGFARLTTKLYNKEFENITDTSLGNASYKVDCYYDEDPSYAISTGRAGNQVKKIKAELSFLASPYERSICRQFGWNKVDFYFKGTR